ncbi:MAG: hypothetical protein EA352_01620 [Gemmatimonadales bacterium]|nr:MAG: hypothetical protein EA352_01620 [Gemmatimonadales bacterium]
MHRTPALLPALAVSSLLLLSACGNGEPELPPLPDSQEAFWSALQAHCGGAYADVGDDNTDRIMHVRQCMDDEIRIPLHVRDGDDQEWNRSRTWIVTRHEDGLRLKHDHRYPDGTEEDVTQYGGDTQDEGTSEAQEFWADEFTAEVIGEMVSGVELNVWTMEIEEGQRFAYQLRRTGEQWRVRWEFDLTEEVDAPPAPWGYEDTEPTH